MVEMVGCFKKKLKNESVTCGWKAGWKLFESWEDQTQLPLFFIGSQKGPSHKGPAKRDQDPKGTIAKRDQDPKGTS